MRSLYYFPVLIFIFSCVKDKPNEEVQPAVNFGSGKKVYVSNEGNFGSNNASVSLYDIESNTVISDVYKTQNNNAVLGDVCQHINKINHLFYLVINNSNKIVVVNAQDFKINSVITGISSPRFIIPINSNKAYVSSYNSNAISIVDLNSNNKTGSISCKGWTEQLLSFYHLVFVTNLQSNYLYVIDAINDQISDSVLVGPKAGSLVLDKNSKIWVLSSGEITTNTPAKLSRINPITLQVEFTVNFNIGESPTNLCINNTRDQLYYLNNHVYSYSILDTSLPSSFIINGTGHTFYGLGLSPIDNDIYTSDAIDYVQKSTISIHSSTGIFKNSFKAGINASGFYFE